MSPKLYIVLPVHNRRRTTQRFVSCLQQQTFEDFHLLLIDDGSTDGTSDLVRALIPSATVIRGIGRWWWGGSLHQGYRWLKSSNVPASSMVLTINDDAVFDANYLQTAVSILGQRQHTLLISNAYGEQSRKLFDGGIHADWRRLKFSLAAHPAEVNCASTRGLFLYAADFMDIGGFHPFLLPHYASDYEFTTRAYKKGYTLLADERLKLFANEAATGIATFEQETSYRDFLRHLFSKKYMLHPVYYANFIVLACPWPWKPFHWLIIWLSTFWKLIKNFFILVVLKSR